MPEPKSILREATRPGRALLALTLLGSACSSPPRLDPAVAAWTSTLACAAPVAERLRAWQAGSEFHTGAPLSGRFTDVRRISTGRLGVWIEAARGPEGVVRLRRITAGGVRSVTIDPECRVEEVEDVPLDRHAGPERPGPHPDADDAPPFTDADLARAIDRATARGGAGVAVYLWSPHMPLAVDGWATLREAADAFDLDPVPVLIAEGDRDFAAREAARGGIPAEGLREVASVELLMRDAQVHAPSILVFTAEGAAPVLPGYRDADGYARFLSRVLGRPPADRPNGP